MSVARTTRLYHKLQIAAHRVQKTTDQVVAEASGLTSAQSAVLSIVSTVPGISQRDLAGQLSLNESAVTAMVTRLIGDGLLAREKSPSDKRVWVLGLTQSGVEKLHQITAPFSQVNERMETALSDDEIRQLASLLVKLSDAFSKTDSH